MRGNYHYIPVLISSDLPYNISDIYAQMNFYQVLPYRCDQGIDGKGHLRMGKLHLVDLAVSLN